MTIDRRKLLQAGAALAASSALVGPFRGGRAAAQAAPLTFTPEAGASLRLCAGFLLSPPRKRPGTPIRKPSPS
ncbi:hypothetical protein QWZ10_23425 [Paracoccus cavernae]|uniref:Twin-arginine translocation signal domain-containing protein n=1 Tax=Paracoccus cavernae TaxID=1571207 RepID=A0ABT8DB30_9RHOB|nr:hypothetical protein [Paracoccus cavernae]